MFSVVKPRNENIKAPETASGTDPTRMMNGSRKLSNCAASTRLRPILMTTAATVVGHFPLVLATGPGAGARNSIGIMLVSGMVIGTVFTLFVVPSIYMLVARTRVTVPNAVRTREKRVPELAEAV